MSLTFTGCGDVACVQNPVGPERAVELAREYLLSHSIAEYEQGPSYLRRFGAALRQSGMDEADIARLAVARPRFPISCEFRDAYHYVSDDPIALQEYKISFYENVPVAGTTDKFTIRMLVVLVSYCGRVLWGDLGPHLYHDQSRHLERSQLIPGYCKQSPRVAP